MATVNLLWLKCYMLLLSSSEPNRVGTTFRRQRVRQMWGWREATCITPHEAAHAVTPTYGFSMLLGLDATKSPLNFLWHPQSHHWQPSHSNEQLCSSRTVFPMTGTRSVWFGLVFGSLPNLCWCNQTKTLCKWQKAGTWKWDPSCLTGTQWKNTCVSVLR